MQAIPTSNLFSLFAGLFPGVPQAGTPPAPTGTGLAGTFEALFLDVLARAGIAPSEADETQLPALLAGLLQAAPQVPLPVSPVGGPNGDSEGVAGLTAGSEIPPDLLSRFEILTQQIAAANQQAAASTPVSPTEAFIRLVADQIEAATGVRPKTVPAQVPGTAPSLETVSGLRIVSNAATAEHVQAVGATAPLPAIPAEAAALASAPDPWGYPPSGLPGPSTAATGVTVLGKSAVPALHDVVWRPAPDFPSVVLLHGELAAGSTGPPSTEAVRFLAGTPAATVLASRSATPFTGAALASAEPTTQPPAPIDQVGAPALPLLSAAQPAAEPPRAGGLETAIAAVTSGEGTHASAEHAAARNNPAVQILAERLAILSAAREGLAHLRGGNAPAVLTDLPADTAPAVGMAAAVGLGQGLPPGPTDPATASGVSGRPAPVALDSLPQHVVREAHFLARQDGGSVQLRLQPESLGRLTVRVMQDHDVVRIELTAQSHQVRDVLQGQLPQLRQQLGDLGLSLGGLTVSVETGDRQEAGGQRHGSSPGGTSAATPAGVPATTDGGLPRQSAPRVVAGRLDLVA